MAQWFEKFIGVLKDILEKPPYLIFVFISAVFMIVAIISEKYFDQIFVFFLYSISGTIWRYIERDFLGALRPDKKNSENQVIDKKDKIIKLVIISIYHAGNVSLFIILLHYLRFI